MIRVYPALRNESARRGALRLREHTLITSAACNNLFTFFSPLQSCQMVPDGRERFSVLIRRFLFSREGTEPVEIYGAVKLREEEDARRH